MLKRPNLEEDVGPYPRPHLLIQWYLDMSTYYYSPCCFLHFRGVQGGSYGWLCRWIPAAAGKKEFASLSPDGQQRRKNLAGAGALDYKECYGDDLDTTMGVPFPRQMRAKRGETVVFAYILFKSPSTATGSMRRS